jgi:hypothetical protein
MLNIIPAGAGSFREKIKKWGGNPGPDFGGSESRPDGVCCSLLLLFRCSMCYTANTSAGMPWYLYSILYILFQILSRFDKTNVPEKDRICTVSEGWYSLFRDIPANIFSGPLF